ncbi:MAG: flagellar hook-basal body complex protein FliE [Anaerolineaceae bacterium]|nr:flagellar hook-basal body complex protein FliE [Anaerolineaceae bacterium]
MEINPISIAGIKNIAGASTQSASGIVSDVGSTFQQLLESLSETEKTSDNLMKQFSSGEDVELHELLISMEQTDINFRVAINVRDKLVSAYQEIMRMQV